MRKNRILAMQKIAEQKKKEALDPGQPSAPNESDIATLPKQTVSSWVYAAFNYALKIIDSNLNGNRYHVHIAWCHIGQVTVKKPISWRLAS